MGHREPLNKQEQDAFTGWRRVLHWHRGQLRRVKARFNRRIRRRANREAIALLREWMLDESGYDEAVWPVVKQAIEDNRLSGRPRFSVDAAGETE